MPCLGVCALVLVAACAAPPEVQSPPVPPLTSAMMPPAMPAETSGDLMGRVYAWQQSRMRDGSITTAAAPERYTIEFLLDGRVSVRADCNRGAGHYTLGANGGLSISALATTKMACPPGSQDGVFLRQLEQVSGYDLAGRSLTLNLASGTGAMQLAVLTQ